MGYLIAVGSSDEINVNLKFGEADEVLIYEVEGLSYSLKEKRKLNKEKDTKETGTDINSLRKKPFQSLILNAK